MARNRYATFGTVWTFKSPRFTVSLELEPDWSYRYDGDDENGETQAALDAGELVAFNSIVTVELDGEVIGQDTLGGRTVKGNLPRADIRDSRHQLVAQVHFALCEPVSVKPSPEALALAFVAILKDWLTPDQWADMRAKNASPAYADVGACASHDYCDANMAMLEALESLWNDGTDNPRDIMAETDLFNAAWLIASRDHLKD